ncbi:hypothetical protein M0812_05606 [Anaeramoeba flamelloides]|uniref:Uncharacterized protein n=1 Tax=Anaeramoeba flamelloides TaxID=1746091 RepID=A0AAV8A8Z4_9EUKA|nr:hypothetical protein M0812_05606 [Anaeramoeba flamelloides]
MLKHNLQVEKKLEIFKFAIVTFLTTNNIQLPKIFDNYSVPDFFTLLGVQQYSTSSISETDFIEQNFLKDLENLSNFNSSSEEELLTSSIHSSFSESSQNEKLLESQNSENENSDVVRYGEAREDYNQLDAKKLNQLRSRALYPFFNEIINLPFPPAEEILNKIHYTNYAGWMIWKQLSTPQLKRIFYEESVTLYMNKKKYKEIQYKFLRKPGPNKLNKSDRSISTLQTTQEEVPLHA